MVGLISIEIFGCRDPQAQEYAEQLGLALQLTNILRDVGEDFANIQKNLHGGGIKPPLNPAREPGDPYDP